MKIKIIKMKEYKDGLTAKKNSLSFKKNTKSRNYINNYNSMNYSYIGNNNNFGQITNKFTFKTNSFQKMHNIKYNTDKKRSISIENYRSRGSSGKKYLKKFRLKGNKEKSTKNNQINNIFDSQKINKIKNEYFNEKKKERKKKKGSVDRAMNTGKMPCENFELCCHKPRNYRS